MAGSGSKFIIFAARMDTAIRDLYPVVKRIFIEAESWKRA